MEDTDARLVERARDGDDRAFEHLVRRHLRAAHAVAFSLTGERADAEDVCQDAFIAALERLEKCREPDRFRSWLLAIVRNRAHNFRRHSSLRQGPPVHPGTPSRERGPAAAAEDRLLRERLMDAMTRIPETHRQVVLLHDLEGWPHKDIGETLGITEGSSRVYLHKARRALREILGPDMAEEAGS
ncbi:MAG TPA: RNA polymerase sigma factor [Longimicrobiales bacterium]|nr:RNA polymerase sigma factor [Longimicrobiales bacterium]